MPLLSKALPRDVLLWGPFCDGPSPRWPQPFAQGFDSRVFPSPCVSFHPHHPLSHVITRYLTLSHPSASYRTIGLAERLNFAAWTRFLGRPASRLATADVRLSCRIQVSTVFDMLIHTKGGPNLWQARRPPPQPQREKRNPLRPLAQEVECQASLLVADGLLHFSVIGRRENCILAW